MNFNGGQQTANDYAKSMRTQARAVDQTFGMTEEQFQNRKRMTAKGKRILWIVLAVLFVIAMIIVLVWVYRKPVKNFGKPKSRR